MRAAIVGVVVPLILGAGVAAVHGPFDVTVLNQPATYELAPSTVVSIVTPDCYVRPRAWQVVSNTAVNVPLDGGSSDRTALIITNIDDKDAISCTGVDPVVNPTFAAPGYGSYLDPLGGSVKYGIRSSIQAKCIANGARTAVNLVVEEEICR